jgi:hypothetical protein
MDITSSNIEPLSSPLSPRSWREGLRSASELLQREPLSVDDQHALNQLASELQENLSAPGHDIPNDAQRYIGDIQRYLTSGVRLSPLERQNLILYARQLARDEAASEAREEATEVAAALGHEMHNSFTSSQKRTYSFLSQYYPQFANEDPYTQFAMTRDVDALMQNPNSPVGQALVELQNNPEARRVGEEAERELNEQVQNLRREHPALDESLRRLTEENYGVVMPVAREGIEAARAAAARGDLNAAREHLERANNAQADVRGRIVQDVVNSTSDPVASRILQAEFAGLSPREIDQRIREFDRSRPEVQEALRAAQAAGYDLSRLPPEQARLVALSTTRATMDFAVPAVTVAQHYRERTQSIAREQGVTAEVAEQRARAEFAELMRGPADQVVDRLIERNYITENQRAETYAMVASVPEADRVNFIDAIGAGRGDEARRLAGAENLNWKQQAAAMNFIGSLDSDGYQQMVATEGGFQKFMSSAFQPKTPLAETAAVATGPASGEQPVSITLSSNGGKPAPLPDNITPASPDMARALASAKEQGITRGSVEGGQAADSGEPLSAATVAMAPQTRATAASQISA